METNEPKKTYEPPKNDTVDIRSADRNPMNKNVLIISIIVVIVAFGLIWWWFSAFGGGHTINHGM